MEETLGSGITGSVARRYVRMLVIAVLKRCDGVFWYVAKVSDSLSEV